jgi:NAD(P)-dependent dehydrogenase (short-subunit alcohol dehydrogenase family)
MPTNGPNDLTGQVALVTGGGQGLGAAICRALGEAGSSVIVTDVRADTARRVAEALQAAGAKASGRRLDVTADVEAREIVDLVTTEYGRLDILVNNAGTDVTAPFDELSVADWDRVVRVNLRGAFLLAHHVFPGMKRQRRGHIVNVASTAAKRTWANAAAYHASKWGVLGLSHALHVEGRPHGVKVTAVISGGMRTPFLLERFPELDPSLLQDPRTVAETIRFVLTQPDETVIPEVMVLPMRETSWP